MEVALRACSTAFPCSSPLRQARLLGILAGRGGLHRRGSTSLLQASADPRPGAGPIEVIGIGSRKDAVIDFCLAASSSSSCFRFWTFNAKESVKVQFLHKCIGTDMVVRNGEAHIALDPQPPAVILVVSAGHGVDLVAGTELLYAAKSAGGLSVAILLKPFSFEGLRRLEEVDDLVKKLRDCSNFYIVVEADSLLKVEAETLAEALESANNAVFLAINTISVLTSEMHKKVLNTPDGQMKEVKPVELLKLLESYREAKVGFGAGYNIKVAIREAVFRCPYVGDSIKDLDGLVIFNLASACPMEENDLFSHICAFRQVTSFTREIIYSAVHDPDLEPNLIIVTLLIVGCSVKRAMPIKKGFFSGLAVHVPFLSSLLGRSSLESSGSLQSDCQNTTADLCNSPDNGSFSDSPGAEKEAKSSMGEPDIVDSSDTSHQLISDINVQADDGEADMQREQPDSWNTVPGYQIAQIWAKERATLSRDDKINRQPFLGPSPIGIKSSDQYFDRSSYPDSKLPKTSGLFHPNIPSTDLPNAVTLLKGKNVSRSTKKGLLSARAASMLEAERDSLKNWAPILEMQYRGGVYRGRCQGGLPEGKGRVTFSDGSFYDGMWRYGKRSGPGTFCYSNGDVFQGSWRDDLMHGKGWFYFHDGDRWFANFWKGKANGEGRLYSKDGSVFFGHFHNGWRDGQSLYIDSDGSRWTEIWDEGVLISRARLEEDNKTGG